VDPSEAVSCTSVSAVDPASTESNAVLDWGSTDHPSVGVDTLNSTSVTVTSLLLVNVTVAVSSWLVVAEMDTYAMFDKLPSGLAFSLSSLS